MFWTRMVLAGAIFMAVVSAPAQADGPGYSELDIEDLYGFRTQNKDAYAGYDFLPPVLLLPPDIFEFFQWGMAEGSCHSAIVTLQYNFSERYPELPAPYSSDGFRAWELIVLPRYYPRPLLCRAVLNVKEKEKEIAAAGLPPRPFAQNETRQRPPGAQDPWLLRDMAIQNFFALALEDYAPAQMALVLFSQESESLRLTPAYAYFLLARAQTNGFEDARLEPLLAEAQGALDASDVRVFSHASLTANGPKRSRWSSIEPWPLVTFAMGCPYRQLRARAPE